MTPSPPHADMNAKRAVVVFWKDHPQRFVFSHEASYCPLLELPSGAAMCNQFFEGNLGEAELFNNMGRKEKNSFVDVIESGPQRVWVRWIYFAVNMLDDAKPRLRGTEDYFAYPNGLVLRRMTYESLMPNDIVGYGTQPVELFGVAPVGSTHQGPVPARRETRRLPYACRARRVWRQAIRHLLGSKRARSAAVATTPRWRPLRGRPVVPWSCRSATDCSSPCSATPAGFRRRRTS